MRSTETRSPGSGGSRPGLASAPPSPRISRSRSSRREAATRGPLVRYEARREAGRHGGPALEGVRPYELDWRLDPKASRAAPERPQTRRLLLEVAAP